MGTQMADRVLALARKKGLLRVRDLTERGINPQYLRRLCEKGQMTKIAPGLYICADAPIPANIGLAEAAKLVPKAVICLLSALQFHNIGTQSPFQVWIALDRKARHPRVEYPPLRVVRFSGKALTEGIEKHYVEAVQVKIYSPAKTVADCFKYRNRIGLDVALEALRYCRAEKKCTHADLWHYAKICRVANVMKPYLESIQ